MDTSIKLSANFTLNEFLKSQEGERLGIDNLPTPEVITNLRNLAIHILQPVRSHFGLPITINSGYRCPALNEAIGAAKNSQHMVGQAADFEVIGKGNPEIAQWIKDNLDFDQLILEFFDPSKNDPNSGWVHCSYANPKKNRKEVLTINRSGTFKGLITR
jgi:hypothetical protein